MTARPTSAAEIPIAARPLRVSVIVPVLNEETRIREQLAALLAQPICTR